MVLSIKFGKSMTSQTCAFEKSSSGQWPSLQLERQRKPALLAFKCVNGLTPFIFKEYFKRVSHGRGTRGDSAYETHSAAKRSNAVLRKRMRSATDKSQISNGYMQKHKREKKASLFLQ